MLQFSRLAAVAESVEGIMNASLKSVQTPVGCRTPSAHRSCRLLSAGDTLRIERGHRQSPDLAGARVTRTNSCSPPSAALVGGEGQRFHGDRFQRPDLRAAADPSKIPRSIFTCRCTGWAPRRDACCTPICRMRRRSAMLENPRLEMAVQSALGFYDDVAYDSRIQRAGVRSHPRASVWRGRSATSRC